MLLYCFLMTKRIAFKSPIVLYFHPLVIEIFWLGRGVLEVVLPGLLK